MSCGRSFAEVRVIAGGVGFPQRREISLMPRQITLLQHLKQQGRELTSEFGLVGLRILFVQLEFHRLLPRRSLTADQNKHPEEGRHEHRDRAHTKEDRERRSCYRRL